MPEETIDPGLLEQTKTQIRKLVAEIAELAESDIQPAEFHVEFLNRVVAAVAASGGALWLMDGRGGLKLQHQLEFGLTGLLDGRTLPESPILVVEALEPSWAVVFPRFAAVVADLGGELSHASILLREAGIPAVVNARGAFQSIADGDLIRIDPAWGEVRIESRHNGHPTPDGP
jgi:phosphohistidine swiveling domain-containing protein